MTSAQGPDEAGSWALPSRLSGPDLSWQSRAESRSSFDWDRACAGSDASSRSLPVVDPDLRVVPGLGAWQPSRKAAGRARVWTAAPAAGMAIIALRESGGSSLPENNRRGEPLDHQAKLKRRNHIGHLFGRPIVHGCASDLRSVNIRHRLHSAQPHGRQGFFRNVCISGKRRRGRQQKAKSNCHESFNERSPHSENGADSKYDADFSSQRARPSVPSTG
jgi:hypothetical protein